MFQHQSCVVATPDANQTWHLKKCVAMCWALENFLNCCYYHCNRSLTFEKNICRYVMLYNLLSRVWSILCEFSSITRGLHVVNVSSKKSLNPDGKYFSNDGMSESSISCDFDFANRLCKNHSMYNIKLKTPFMKFIEGSAISPPEMNSTMHSARYHGRSECWRRGP